MYLTEDNGDDGDDNDDIDLKLLVCVLQSTPKLFKLRSQARRVATISNLIYI